ncbi:folate-binding protein YgfZ [Romeria aff. gracilis LEGE 07310]|uniref:Folate-binding protein YgfZ n=1 Tax=Vasconcelosia minhoensis LEGE 07310 TaxID=915328 RepID=A0A8J7DAE6_9CYAN|nr:folate-binding protein YgfZ [Romeria gracilis]MBE9076357.1 folate-binding protein YgfZ [Romeria aff. gracilis LEGE 07310]
MPKIALFDRSRWGRIRVSDADRIRFLHNQTTQDFQRLQPGQGGETVFVTSTARTLDLVTAYVEEASVLLLTSPEMAGQLVEWMDRYIFFADKVQLADITAETFAFTLVGKGSAAVLEKLGVPIDSFSRWDHRPAELANTSLLIAADSGLALPGYTLIGPSQQAEVVWQALLTAGLEPQSEASWEQLRIQQGRPLPGHELTEEDNPLEAGLWHAISFEKGCYIGQETIARLNTYQGVKKRLWGLKLSGLVEPGIVIEQAGERVGRVTSAIATDEGAVGLGYLRTKAGGAGLAVQAGAATAEVVAVPYLSHEYLAKAATP